MRQSVIHLQTKQELLFKPSGNELNFTFHLISFQLIVSGLVGQTLEHALKPVVVGQNPKLDVKSSLKKILDLVLAQVNAMESVAIQMIAQLVGLVSVGFVLIPI